MPETTGDGTYSGQKQNKKITAVAVVRRTTPERGRYGGVCLSTPLHASRSPSAYTAGDVYSSTYHTAAHALVKSLFLCRAGMNSSTTCVGTQVQCWDFHSFTILRHPGERAICPRESLSTPPAGRGGHQSPFFRRRSQRAAMWGGRGATARPQEAKWSSGVAAF